MLTTHNPPKLAQNQIHRDSYKRLIKDNNLTVCLHNRKIIRIFALRKVRNDNCVIRLIWTKGREE